MKQPEFLAYYRTARTEPIVTSDLFNTAGYFWIDLTSRQLDAMYTLMLEQGAEETPEGISLQNGIRINKRGIHR